MQLLLGIAMPGTWRCCIVQRLSCRAPGFLATAAGQPGSAHVQRILPKAPAYAICWSLDHPIDHRTPPLLALLTDSCSLHCSVRTVLLNSSRLLKSDVRNPFFFSCPLSRYLHLSTYLQHSKEQQVQE